MKLKIASLSDIHLGHSNTSTSSIIRNLDNNFIAHPEFKDLDIIFIAGDLFDRLLAHDDPNRPEIYLWFVRLCEACAKHDIMVRIRLDGIYKLIALSCLFTVFSFPRMRLRQIY